MINDIREVITSVNVENGVTLVTVFNLPNNSESIADIFNCLAEKGVNVDMISLNPSSGVRQTVSFSASDGDLSDILSTLGFLKNSYRDLRIDVNTNNCKLTFAGDAMRERYGVAAFVFSSLGERNISVKLITTSETKISCLINESDYSEACDLIDKTFGIKIL
ncbi:MAG: ACT domain-containing protein [Clostridia bacterium]|nr:ACT domain-containing protein [Clostridia bacterium]